MPLSAIFSCVWLAWVMPRRIVDLFACWRGYFGRLLECYYVEDSYVLPLVVSLEINEL